MSRSRDYWFCLLVALVVSVVMTSQAEAQCARCCQPPSGNGAWDCCHTFYNAANACVHGPGGSCSHLGNCQGDLGPCEAPGQVACTVERWACGTPLKNEWRLERYTIELPEVRPPSVAANTAKTKA